ncbi:MAG: hypothetical protein RLZZ450_4188, partial [Pseudomonadota bacterium]
LLFSSYFALALSLGVFGLAHAQEPSPASPSAAPDAAVEPSAAPAAASAEPAAPRGDEATPAPEAAPEPEKPRVLEPPNLGPLAVDPSLAGPELPDPAAAADRLDQAAPPQPTPKRGWSMPETIFHLHGYMRLRGTFLKDGALGHNPTDDRPRLGSDLKTVNQNYDPFPYFNPDDSTVRTGGTAPVTGGCKDSRGADGKCGKHGQVTGDLRLRLKPEIHLSDDVRVKAWIDVMDNVGLGTLGYGPGTQPSDLGSDNAIRARRVWGEARNRDIGELRFGRMGADWGLGILDNGGDRNGIDSDFSSEVDRIMGITNLAGYTLMAAYDWASEGKVLGKTQTPSGVPIDAAQRDDLDAFTFAAAHKLDEDAQQGALTRGEAVFNYGVYFVYRNQFLLSGASPTAAAVGLDTGAPRYSRLQQHTYTPDLWFQVLWEGLRVELEAAYVAGSREGGCPQLTLSTGSRNDAADGTEGAGPTTGSCKFRQLGVALETEYRLFDERLGLHLMAGLATGDSNAYGLAATNDPNYQRVNSGSGANNTVSTYSFHPDYRIDLILWRTVMRRVAGAYYFRPGVSYDFIRDPYGQLAGGRLDVVYSRASAPSQTWGNDGNLGLELDMSLYYRSEDGPDALDGFYGLVQFGVLFPFSGLEYDFPGAANSKNAMILRGIAGIAF